MISQKRILAARANGALSRGPKTSQGKSRSQHALRSRRLSDCIVLGSEPREAFQELFAFHVDAFTPLDDVEMGMVEEMSSAYWRIRRNWAIESYLLDSATAAQPEGPELARLAAAHAEVATQPQWAQLRKDETRLHVIYQRALANLLALRSARFHFDPTKSPVCNISSGPVDPNEPNEPKEPNDGPQSEPRP